MHFYSNYAALLRLLDYLTGKSTVTWKKRRVEGTIVNDEETSIQHEDHP
jgi:hypothetical protein